MFGDTVAYKPPKWVEQSLIPSSSIPKLKVCLGRFPTPIHKFDLPGVPAELGLNFYIKRDDLTSFDLSGNKVRKLEFLIAEAKNSPNNYDCVITVGGLQSNHCRATAVAARQVGLEPFLILRKPLPVSPTPPGEDEEIGLTGNLLFDRMIGANIRLVTPQQYGALGGSVAVCDILAAELRAQGRNPYIVPLGGSNALGAYGYIECIQEIVASGMHFDHIVFGCGSGGTAAGIALGVKLAGLQPQTQVHAIGVCDSPQYFLDHIEETVRDLGIPVAVPAAATTTTTAGDATAGDATAGDAPAAGLGPVKELLNLYHGEGKGYARSTPEELAYIIQVAHSTGIVLDPVYSGKGLYHFVHHVLTPTPQQQQHPSGSAGEEQSCSDAGRSDDGTSISPSLTSRIRNNNDNSNTNTNTEETSSNINSNSNNNSVSSVFRRGHKVLFIHTGGSLGLYDKESEVVPLLPAGKVSRLVVPTIA
jgi:D-cysteine desulfhydrase